MSRILVLTPFPPPSDGIGSHSRNLVEAWVRQGHDVLVMCQGPGGKTERHEGYDVARLLGVFGFRRARSLANTFCPDFVFCQFAISALTTSTPTVLKLCRSMRREGIFVAMAFHEPGREIAILGPLGNWVYRRAVRSCNVPITFSGVATAALDHMIESPNVFSGSPGFPEYEPSTHADIERVRQVYGFPKPFVFYFGFIHPDKGVDTLMSAIPYVTQRYEGDLDVVIAGRPRPRSSAFKFFGLRDHYHYRQIRSLAVDSPPQTRIIFSDYVPYEDLGHLLAAAAVVVLPYRRTAQSGVATHVLAAGSPAVVTDIPGLREIFKDAAIYAQVENPADLARAITDVLKDPQLQSDLKLRARTRAASEGYNKVARDIFEIMLR